jgi:2-polyprenyl-3-methyl-5-hydroxy-6-metoxy-1,4-benzoquinol methylase
MACYDGPMENERSLDWLYEGLWDVHGDAYAELDRTLGPRSGEALYEAAANLGAGRGWRVLDAGCGRGHHSIELSRRFGCHVLGIDAVRGPMAEAARQAPIFAQARMEAVPVRDQSFDLVWCRDMLVHVPAMDRAVAECARVLKPGGHMLVWATIATGLMEPAEAARVYAALAISGANTELPRLRRSFQNAGLRIVAEKNLTSELIEFYEERDGRASRELMRIARMRRRRAALIAQWGQARYETVLALYHWIVYHLLGKLETVLFHLQKS